ncbi:hypothetical protein D3C71_1070020 [compost metagenome]
MNVVKQGAAVVESYSYNNRSECVLRSPVSGDAQVTVYDEGGWWVGNHSAAPGRCGRLSGCTTIR